MEIGCEQKEDRQQAVWSRRAQTEMELETEPVQPYLLFPGTIGLKMKRC